MALDHYFNYFRDCGVKSLVPGGVVIASKISSTWIALMRNRTSKKNCEFSYIMMWFWI